MKKKTGAMLLAICMLLGMLSGCGSNIHIAEAGTAHGKNFHAALMHTLDSHFVYVGIDKRANAVKALRDFGGMVVELFFKVRDFVIFAVLVKIRTVIRLCIEKRDFFHVVWHILSYMIVLYPISGCLVNRNSKIFTTGGKSWQQSVFQRCYVK